MLLKVLKTLRRDWVTRSLKSFWRANTAKEFKLDAILPAFTKKGKETDLEYDYGLVVWKKRFQPFRNLPKTDQFFFDAKFLVLLNVGLVDRKKTAVACIAFNSNDADSEIKVVQIQGVSYPEKVGLTKENIALMLAPIKWERLLLAFLCSIAKITGIRSVHLQPGRKNEWRRNDNAERTQRLFIRYDITARRSGFKFDESADDYVLSADAS